MNIFLFDYSGKLNIYNPEWSLFILPARSATLSPPAHELQIKDWKNNKKKQNREKQKKSRKKGRHKKRRMEKRDDHQHDHQREP